METVAESDSELRAEPWSAEMVRLKETGEQMLNRRSGAQETQLAEDSLETQLARETELEEEKGTDSRIGGLKVVAAAPPPPPPPGEKAPPAKKESRLSKAKAKAGAFKDMFTFTLRLDLPGGFGITDIVSSLCGTFADDMRFSQVAVYVSSGGFADNDMATVHESKAGMGMVKIKEGITFLLTVDLRSTCGFLRPILKHLGGFLIQAYFTIPLVPSNGFTFGMAVVWVVPKNNFVEAGAIMFQLFFSLVPVLTMEIEFKGKLVLYAGPDRIILECTVFITILPVLGFRVEGDMIGCWKKALGIPGFTLCDVGGGIGCPASIIPPNYFRIQGAMALGSGKEQMRFGIKIKVDATKPAGALESAILGYYLGPKVLCLEHLIQFPVLLAYAAGIPGVPAPASFKISPICFKKIIVKASLMALTINTAADDDGNFIKEKFPAGVMLDIQVTIFGKFVRLMVAIGPYIYGIISLDVQATFEGFTLGPLTVSGKGCDMVAGNADDGPCLTLGIDIPIMKNIAKYANAGTYSSGDTKPVMPSFHFGVTGMVSIAGIFRSEVTIHIKPFALLVEVTTFFYLATAEFRLTCGDTSLSTPKPTMDFKLSIKFTVSGAALKVINVINEYLDAFDKEVRKATRAATGAIRGTAQELAAACTGEGAVVDEGVHTQKLSIDKILSARSVYENKKIPNEELLRDDVSEEEVDDRVMESVKRIHAAASTHPQFTDLAKTFGPFSSEKVHSDHLLKIIQLAEEVGYFDDDKDPMPEALKQTAAVWEQVKKEDREKNNARRIGTEIVAAGKYIKGGKPLGSNPQGFGFTLSDCKRAAETTANCTGRLFSWAPEYNGQCMCALDDTSYWIDSAKHNVYAITNHSITNHSREPEAEQTSLDMSDSHSDDRDLHRAIDALQRDHDARRTKTATHTKRSNMAAQPDKSASEKLHHSHAPGTQPRRRLLNQGVHRHAPPSVYNQPEHGPAAADTNADDKEDVSLDALGDSVSDRVDAPMSQGSVFGTRSKSSPGGKALLKGGKAKFTQLWGHRWGHWHVPHRWHWHIPHRWHIHIPHFHIPPPSKWGDAIKSAFNWVKNAVVSVAKLAVQVVKSVAKAAVAIAKTVIKKAYEFAKKLAIMALKVLCKGMSFGLDKAIAKGIKAVAELGAYCVMAVGKLVSMAVSSLKNLFSFRYLRYEGSLYQTARGNWGTTWIGFHIDGKPEAFRLQCDLTRGMKCITEAAGIFWKVIKKAALAKFNIFKRL
jgi:hypothetical protein